MRFALAIVLAACATSATPPPAAPTSNAAPTATAKPPAKAIEDQLVHGTPTPENFAAVVDAFPTMSASQRATVAAIGSSKEAPIRVPDIHAEYVWVEKIACNGGAGNVGRQSLLTTPQGELDELAFTCPGDATEHAAYFDFSADPSEQKMRAELGQ